MPRKGIGGKPVGPGVHGREQKFANTAFKNTMNKDTQLNNSQELNTELAMNTPKEVVFKSTNDILHILQTHPDFLKASKSDFEPMLAGLLSAAMVAGGIALLYISGGATIGPTVLLLKSLGSAATAAGTAGGLNALKGGIKGNFSWHKWGEEVITSAAVAFFTIAPTSFAGYGIANTGFSFLKLPCEEVTAEMILIQREWVGRLTSVATATINTFLQTGAAVVKAKNKNQKLDPVSLALPALHFITNRKGSPH